MNIMRKIAALVLALGVLFGGFAAPAQADVQPMTSGSTVDFAGVGPGVPTTIDLYITSTTGAYDTQALYTVRNNIQYVCPKNDNWYMTWHLGTDGEQRYSAPGKCVRLTVAGRFIFYVLKA